MSGHVVLSHDALTLRGVDELGPGVVLRLAESATRLVELDAAFPATLAPTRHTGWRRTSRFPKIMKEGRKYGVAVVVASQGVADFHKDVLANAGTKVAFRCNFLASRTVAGFIRGRADQDLAVALENLSVGQAYVSTPDRAEARKVFMASG